MNYLNKVFLNCFDVLNPTYKSFLLFGLVEDLQTQNKKCFCYLNHHCHYSQVSWKIVSNVFEHMNY